jgi:mycothiol synthase
MTELPAGYLLRRPREADAQAIVELLVACDIADHGRPDSTLEDLRADWAHPRFDRARDAWTVTGPDRSIVGYAWAWARVPYVDVQADVLVQPDHRGKRIEEVLLGVLEGRGREHAAGAPAGAKATIALFAKPGSALAALLELRGYVRVRTYLRMTIHLKAGYPAARTLDGIEIRAFRLGVDERAAHATVEEAFADHFRFAPEPHEEWVSRREGHPEFDPDLWLVAWDGEEPVGAVLSYKFGDLGWVRELGVRARWRGRGVGRALLLESFRAFDQRCLDRVSLGVDAENESGATRLYESAGMREEERHDLYRLALRARGEAAPATPYGT